MGPKLDLNIPSAIFPWDLFIILNLLFVFLIQLFKSVILPLNFCLVTLQRFLYFVFSLLFIKIIYNFYSDFLSNLMVAKRVNFGYSCL